MTAARPVDILEGEWENQGVEVDMFLPREEPKDLTQYKQLDNANITVS